MFFKHKIIFLNEFAVLRSIIDYYVFCCCLIKFCEQIQTLNLEIGDETSVYDYPNIAFILSLVYYNRSCQNLKTNNQMHILNGLGNHSLQYIGVHTVYVQNYLLTYTAKPTYNIFDTNLIYKQKPCLHKPYYQTYFKTAV